jgi:hypothetical protein
MVWGIGRIDDGCMMQAIDILKKRVNVDLLSMNY